MAAQQPVRGATKQMSAAEPAVGTFDYVGVWQHPIPTALVLDPRLLPSEKLVWIVLRVTMARPGAVITPTYDYLTAACSLARPTLSKALKVLQLTGWLKAGKRSTDGWVESNSYLMYDQDHSATYAHSTAFKDFARSCLLHGERLRSVVEAVATKFELLELLELARSKKIELLQNSGSKIIELPSSKKIELLEIPRSSKIELLRNVDFSSSSKIELPRVRGSSSCVNNTTAQGEEQKQLPIQMPKRVLVWPAVSEITKAGCKADLAMLTDDVAQQVLDECAAARALGKVRNDTMFLRALITGAIAGTFVFSDAGYKVATERTNAAKRPTSTLTAAASIDEKRSAQRDFERMQAEFGVANA